jgi:uncharacterized protein YycO
MKKNRDYKSKTLRRLVICLTLVALIVSTRIGGSYAQQPGADQRQIDNWLDYQFDPSAAMGSAKNPAVVLPAELASLLGNLSGSKRVGETVFVPAAELKKATELPFASTLLAPVLSQLSNVKSFDGFNAVDGTGVIKQLPSLLHEPDAIARRVTGEDPMSALKGLKNGDLVFGSHVVNYMTWGRYNHVAIVTDAARGLLVEATANRPLDKPGVRTVDLKSFAKGYVHVGVTRVRNARPEQLAEVVKWVEERKGRPYRWPIVMGLDRTDQSRFYCSQLVWLAFKQVMNLDLDVDKGVLIFPDDLYYSNDVEKIVP